MKGNQRNDARRKYLLRSNKFNTKRVSFLQQMQWLQPTIDQYVSEILSWEHH